MWSFWNSWTFPSPWSETGYSDGGFNGACYLEGNELNITPPTTTPTTTTPTTTTTTPTTTLIPGNGSVILSTKTDLSANQFNIIDVIEGNQLIVVLLLVAFIVLVVRK